MARPKKVKETLPPRFFDNGDCLCAYSDPIVINCPQCGRPGLMIIKSSRERELHGSRSTRSFACRSCGHTFEWAPHTIIHSVSDWNKQLPLFFQIHCCNKTLWAFNERHLAYIENYVIAGLRERIPSTNNSLASRLPQWIKIAKNRNAILKTTRRLRDLLYKTELGTVS